MFIYKCIFSCKTKTVPGDTTYENPQRIRTVCIEKIMDTIIHAETHTEHFSDQLSIQNIIVQIHSV